MNKPRERHLRRKFLALFTTTVWTCLATNAAFGNEYFNSLVAMPEHHSSTDLGSTQEVIDEVNYSNKDRALTEYDPAMDAARFPVQQDWGSIAIGDQVRHYFPRISSGNMLVFWEAYASSYFAQDGDIDGVETYKAFQLSDGGDLTLEPRFRFAQVDRPYVARTDVRYYGSGSGVAEGPQDSVGGQTGEFRVLPEVWTRFWVFIDFDNNRLAYWVGDMNRDTETILNFVPFNWTQNYGSGFGIDEFWLEFNSSQQRTGPEAYLWGRNVVVLRDVNDPTAIVEAGSNGLGSASSIPNPPVIVQP